MGKVTSEVMLIFIPHKLPWTHQANNQNKTRYFQFLKLPPGQLSIQFILVTQGNKAYLWNC